MFQDIQLRNPEVSAWFNAALQTCSRMIQRRYLICHVCLQREQPWQLGAHTPGHAMPQPDLDSDKLGLVEGRRGHQLRQTFLDFVRDMNQQWKLQWKSQMNPGNKQTTRKPMKTAGLHTHRIPQCCSPTPLVSLSEINKMRNKK